MVTSTFCAGEKNTLFKCLQPLPSSPIYYYFIRNVYKENICYKIMQSANDFGSFCHLIAAEEILNQLLYWNQTCKK